MQPVNIEYDSIDSLNDVNNANGGGGGDSLKLNPKQHGGGDYDDYGNEYEFDAEDDHDTFDAFDDNADAETKANTAANALRLSGGGGSDDDSDAAANEDDSETDDADDEVNAGDEVDDDDAVDESDEGDEDEGDEGAPSQHGKLGKDNEGDGSNHDADDDDDNGADDDDDDDVDDDDDDDAGDDEDKFKKFNHAMRTNYLVDTHPESTNHNDDEIHSLAHVVRDKTGTIIDPLHRTIPILTKYEKTRILGVRTRQLNDGAASYVKVEKSIIDGYIIALRELDEKKIPFIVRRPLPNGGSEYWYLQDLEVI
jgi:DNA-directed RNA polymerase subunit K/omega